ncbi:MAG: tRNA preQ1(34) S-adenosylmethionine ribosyltransferase-isomerase QueA [Thermoleophilia bacterium]
MHLSELDFDFPQELIAQRPLEPRDSCRLMYLHGRGQISHARFSDLAGLLHPRDTLVFNNSRVLPARLVTRKPTGGRVEILFIRPAPLSTGASVMESSSGNLWEVMARPSHRLQAGTSLFLPGGEELTLHTLLGDGRWIVGGPPHRSLLHLMDTYGTMPIPPYIKAYPADPTTYQTVYASEPGSAAAPTAGLHFTPRLLKTLENAGIRSAHVTLHVGLDTFRPIREEVVEKHRIHREVYSVSRSDLATLRRAHADGGRLVAVGTTATRVLETLAAEGQLDEANPSYDHPEGDRLEGSTQIFITPGYRFRAVDALLTNFHLPRSTVLALAMAFAGRERLWAAYREAIKIRYRFFSFGDAMLIEPPDKAPAGREWQS